MADSGPAFIIYELLLQGRGTIVYMLAEEE
jgi:hypothetical protein